MDDETLCSKWVKKEVHEKCLLLQHETLTQTNEFPTSGFAVTFSCFYAAIPSVACHIVSCHKHSRMLTHTVIIIPSKR